MSLKRIEIVTPVHNRRDETLQCLRSLYRSALADIHLHIIVVDDGSTDGTATAIEREFPDVEIIKADGSLWYTAATNRGFEAALKHKPDYILAINNDSIFDEHCIQRLVNCAEDHPRSVVGGLLLNWETPHKVFQVSPRWELKLGGYRHWQHQTVWTVPNRPWEVDLIVGNCVLFPAQCVSEVGFMNERLVQFGDAEYTPRMKRLGWRLIIEPSARVFCKPNDIVTGFRKLPLGDQFNQVFRNPAGPYSWQRRFYGILYGAPSHLQGIVAIPVYLIRQLLGKNHEGSWTMNQSERPLSQIYTSAVVDD